MPPDVLQKCIQANDFRGASVITGVDMQGNKHVIRPTLEEVPSSGAVYATYNNRFDDPTYYSS